MNTQLQLAMPEDFRTKFLPKLSSIWVRELFCLTISGSELGLSGGLYYGIHSVLLLYLDLLLISQQILFGERVIGSNGDPYRFLLSVHPYSSIGDRKSSTI